MQGAMTSNTGVTRTFNMDQLCAQHFNIQYSQARPSAGASAITPVSTPVCVTTVPTVLCPKSNHSVAPLAIATSKEKAASSAGSSEAGNRGTGVQAPTSLACDPMRGMLEAQALATGPAFRGRGLAYAQHIKALAREEFMEKRRRDLEAMGEGDRTKRRKKNDTSITEHQKYRRRLQKNQDSAAAARFAQDAFLANLEAQAEAYDLDMTRMEDNCQKITAERDAYKQLAENYATQLQHCRQVIAALTHQAQNRTPDVDHQSIHYAQLLAAIDSTPTPMPQKTHLQNNLGTPFDLETYHGSSFVIDNQGGCKTSHAA